MATRLTPLVCGDVVFDFSRAYIVGIINATPDSFSDGGLYQARETAIERGRQLIAAGADVLDIGGESTRPGAEAVGVATEIERVVPVIAGLRDGGVPISVDTVKAPVAIAAAEAGASIVNDISGGLFDPEMVQTVAEHQLIYVLGHVRGSDLAAVHAAFAHPPTAADVRDELHQRTRSLPPALRERTIIDPGLGFGKPTALNLELTRNSGSLSSALQCPVMIGPSRKRYLGELTGRGANERDDATIGAALAAVACGAHFVRVHAVGRVRDALTGFEASLEAPGIHG